MTRHKLIPSFVIFWSTLHSATALFGVKPKFYPAGVPFIFRANSLISQDGSGLPFDFSSLPFCHPSNPNADIQTLGEVLMGEKLEDTSFSVPVGQQIECRKLCDTLLDDSGRESIKNLISGKYSYRLLADGLPAVSRGITPDGTVSWLDMNVPVGYEERNSKNDSRSAVDKRGSPSGTFFLNNFFNFSITLSEEFDSNKNISKYSVHDFSVALSSIDEPSFVDGRESCSNLFKNNAPLTITDNSTSYPVFYSVNFDYTSAPWTSRWSTIVDIHRYGFAMEPSSGSQAQPGTLETIQKFKEDATKRKLSSWLPLTSMFIVVGSTITAGGLLFQTLSKDIKTYNEKDSDFDVMDDAGWKLLHSDVFRKPIHFSMLSALVGAGVQLWIVTALITSLFVIGLASPVSKSQIVNQSLILWAFSGFGGGYTAARVSRIGKETPKWQLTVIRTAFMYPGFIFVIFFITNCVLTFVQPSAAMSFLGAVKLLFLWLAVSTPLVFFGFSLGFKRGPMGLPGRVGKIPRQIPHLKSWWQHPMVKCAAGGLVPFSTVVSQWGTLLNSIHLGHNGMMLSFFVFTLCAYIITTIEVSITVTYLQLLSEDYNWAWLSFMAGGSSAFYVFFYSLLYLLNLLWGYGHLKVSAWLVYLGYVSVISFTVFVMSGCIGYVSSTIFVRFIYSSIKYD